VLDVFRERPEYPDLRRKVIELHRRWRKACNGYELVTGVRILHGARLVGEEAMPITPTTTVNVR